MGIAMDRRIAAAVERVEVLVAAIEAIYKSLNDIDQQLLQLNERIRTIETAKHGNRQRSSTARN